MCGIALTHKCIKEKAKEVIELDKASELPISLQKVHKNEVELSGIRKALELESAALISFYAQVGYLMKNGSFWEHEGE